MSEPQIQMDIIKKIASCFRASAVYYTQHARSEMIDEEFGKVKDDDVFDAICTGEIIEKYLNDKPYPSYLVFGKTNERRPLHVLCAYNQMEDTVIVITVYEPDAKLWINFKRRRS